MSMENFFAKLQELTDLTYQVPVVEKKWNDVYDRSRSHEERNILQCPRTSLLAMQNVHNDMKNTSEDSLKTLSNLQLLSYRNQKMLNSAEKILTYLEDEMERTENYLQKFGYQPLQDHSKLHPGEISVSEDGLSSNRADEVATTEVIVPENADTACHLEKESEKQEEEKRYFALPKSPDSPLLASNFRSNTLHSPEAPSLSLEQSPAEQYPSEDGNSVGVELKAIPERRFAELPQSPSLPNTSDMRGEQLNFQSMKFFDTPGISKCEHNDRVLKLTMDKPLFAKVITSPTSPLAPTLESDAASPDLVLYTRRSLLSNFPELPSTIDDDTVYHLKCGAQMNQFMRTPESPELTDVKSKKNQTYSLPETPPEPVLATRSGFGVEIENTNVVPLSDGTEIHDADNHQLSEGSMHQVKESQYQVLPDYLKRVIPYSVATECYKKVFDSSFALPGQKYTSVTTEAKIAEVTNLGTKTKSLILLLQSLKMIRRIRGTEYFEFSNVN